MIPRLVPMLLLLLFAPPASAAGRPGIEEMVAYFDTVVFGSEVGAAHAARAVAKWPQDEEITVGLRGRYTNEMVQMFVKHLREVANLTKLKFNAFGGPEHKDRPAAIDINFMTRAEMDRVSIPNADPALVRKLAASGGCFFIAARKPAERFVKAIIVVNGERPAEHLDACLLEELVQSLGLPNDSDRLRPSVFSDEDHLTALSRHDRILLKALYDRRLPAGTPRARALEIVRPIIAELDLALPPEGASPAGR